MAKRSNISSEDVESKLEEDQVNFSETVEDSPEEVWLVNLIDRIWKVKGPATGQQYVFSGAGAKVLVDKADADILITRQQRSCCGTNATTIMFEIVGE